jgi:hypothetical protein
VTNMSAFERMGKRMQDTFPDQSDLLRNRGDFVSRYCADRGWDPDHLEIEQLLEVRAHPEWKQPGA